MADASRCLEWRRPVSQRELTRTSWGGGGTRGTSTLAPPRSRTSRSFSPRPVSRRWALAIRASAEYMSPTTSRCPDTYARARPSAPGAWARYETAVFDFTVILTGELGAPAELPSNASNSTGASGPATRSNTSAKAISVITSLQSANAFVVEIGKPALGIVSALELGVFRTIVERPELVTLVERGRVQALVSAELGHLVLHPPVEVPVRLTRRKGDSAPESEVYVCLSWPHRI